MTKKESKLEEIYQLIEYSKRTGIGLKEDQLQQIAEREEQYIKEEVLPLLRDSIEPMLKNIQRELTLVVNCRPNEPITLRISRGTNLSDLEDTVELTPDDIPAYHKRSKQQRNGKRNLNKSLKVTLEDGTVLDDRNVTNTFCEVIRRIGLMRVRGLEILASGINIVSTSNDHNRPQRQIGNFFVFTNFSTPRKAAILKEIASRLNLNIEVEVKD